ncbi:hypothetical protein [Rhizobium glycinendophyticum]|uniref:Uncharacterized protein n=1 Tax=Rhizobium glycinendophyticum TaxID=2589807 RepID=A0A504UUL6_9HYPH|nr:hypothetical protein [Rhizobium glycinendophyticum]TPP10431.1 hypothetical protein FJQ55_06165 [Rhizobium glycinendophyticum]
MRTGMALEETGAVLGEMLRRALNARMARAAGTTEGAGPVGQSSLGGGASGDLPASGRDGVGREGE